jgi:hypothetical protein
MAETRRSQRAGEHADPQAEAQAAASERESSAGKLEHVRGGRTTRDDRNDLGVPMLQGDPSEPAGPEDALGLGPKRGDYSERIGPENYHPHEAVLVEADADDPDAPRYVSVPQRPRVADRGDVAGEKGGVTTGGARPAA